ncbi:hypothetical protein EG329_011952 [Mollisiaceae sp. DMI_Dod_QoI]|nr:hypothetical protein EG329_011952 [Helotiales sp. DMI_Dod_QoI]
MDDPTRSTDFEIIIVGAGRLYPGFWTQWTVGIAEFADMPMERPLEEDCRNDCFKAKYTTAYLEKYVDEKHHAGRSLRDRVQFGIQVKMIKKVNEKWNISCINDEGKEVVFKAEKLMLANGENSLPNVPDLPGKETFDGVVIHSQDFGESKIISREGIQHVTVLGAGKSGADIIYEAVKAGKTVTWIVSENGTGPGFFAPVDIKTPYRNVVEANQTRVMSTLQPSITLPQNWWTWFLHNTWIGIWLVTSIFKLMDNEVKKRANYKGRESTKGFELLEYDTEIFWSNCTGGALHHDDLWPLVAQNVTVYRSTIISLSKKTLTLRNGTTIPCDALLLGTGWKPGLDFFSPSLLLSLDLPHNLSLSPSSETQKWEVLTSLADKKILKRFPILANPPPHFQRKLDTTPFRLYNCMVPLHDNTILFLNQITGGNKLFVAEAQAMWACAYFSGKITLPSVEEREKRVAEWITWCKRRYLSTGSLGTFAVFDAVGYVDGLLREMGLEGYRKEKGWWKEWTGVFGPRDLGVAWREYLDKAKKEA